MLRDKTTIQNPDTRQGYMVKITPEGEELPMTIGDIYDMVSPFNLSNSVPEEIRTQFDLARYAFIYSWFAYEMTTLAELQAYATAEMALKRKAKEENVEFERTGLRFAINYALRTGWLSRGNFEYGEGTMPKPCILDFLVDSRNDLMHGKPHLMPDGSQMTIEIVHKLISGLFDARA